MPLKRATHPFSADRPIQSRKEDLLGRSAFAESLASVVRGWTGNDSLVVAFYGPWGNGKSSIKNMMLESLRGEKESAPTIVEFNPWQWPPKIKLRRHSLGNYRSRWEGRTRRRKLNGPSPSFPHMRPTSKSAASQFPVCDRYLRRFCGLQVCSAWQASSSGRRGPSRYSATGAS